MISSLGAIADLFEILADAVIVVDETGRIAYANSAVRRVLGYAAAELTGQPLDALVPEEYRAPHRLHLQAFQKMGQPSAMGQRPVLYALGKSGREIPVSISISNLDIGGRRFSVAVVRDASVVRDHLSEAIAQAESDSLTGIGNRLYLLRRMRKSLALNRPFGLLFLDLRHFKRVNDEHGHRVGDELLRLVARRIRSRVRTEDAAVRLGGDEFVIFLDLVAEPGPLAMRAAAIVASIGKPFRIGELTGRIGVSIGGAIHPRDGGSEDALLAAADRNMYRARSAGAA